MNTQALLKKVEQFGIRLEVRGDKLRAEAPQDVLTPELEGAHPTQLEEHYFRVSPWALSLCGSHMLLAATSDSVLPGVTSAPPPILFVVIAAAFVGLTFTKRWSLHVGVLSAIVAVNAAMLILGRGQ